MKKKLTLILAIMIVTLVSVSMMLFASANTPTTLNVNSGDGITFDNKGLWLADEPLAETPKTFEAWVYLPSDWTGSEPGSVMGNYKGAGEQGFRFRLRENASGGIYPYLMYTTTEKVESNANKQYISCSLTDALIPTDQWVHIAITDDGTNGFKAYINGEMKDSVKQSAEYAAINKCPYNVDYHFVIGAEQATGSNPFKGKIRSTAIFTDVRTQAEIQSDMNSIDLTDSALISAYLLNGKQNAVTIEDAAGNYNMTHGRRNSDWATPEQMPELDEFDYSIALIGDTQAVNKYYPEYMGTYFDWLLEKKEEFKIEHVLNLGDITNNNEDAEWERARDNYFRLNGEIDYTLVRGDHDVLPSSPKGDDDETNDTLPGGDAAKYDRFFDVPEYTDRFNNSEDADYYQDTDPNKSNGSITNSYRVVTLGTKKYLIVTVDKFPSEAVMTWLDDGITRMTAKYPDIKIIMTMHCFIQSDGGWVTKANQIIGETFWNRIKHYSNLEYVICGHDYAWGVVWLKQEADDGHIVNQVLVNPQGPNFDWQGASAMVAMLFIDEDTGDVQVRYYSPTNDRYYVANKNPITTATAGEKAKYALESGIFTINAYDDSVAVQYTIDNDKAIEYIDTDATISASADGSKISVNYSVSDTVYLENGKLSIEYDSNKLSNPEISANGFDVQYYDGKIIVSWEGLELNGKEGTLFEVEFDSDIEAGQYALVDMKTEYIGYAEETKIYYDKDVETSGTIIASEIEAEVYFESGDDFKAKLEEALAIAKYSNVKFVMKTGYTVSSALVIGDSANIPANTVYVMSEEGKSYTLDINDKTIVFSGLFNFNSITLGGGALNNTKNYMFFTEGSKAVFGDSISVVSSSDMTSVAGDYIEVHSGKYHYVGGAIAADYTVNSPTVKILGNSNVTRAIAGACTTGTVTGDAYMEIGGSAVCGYAVASSYAQTGSVHNGELVVNTSGTIERLCGAIAPCGTSKNVPTYTVTVDNADVTTGVMGVRFLNANKTAYANVNITINNATVKNVYAGINVDNASRTNAKFYGSATTTINNGEFDGGVYGGGIITAAGSELHADVTLNVKGGTFTSSVFGGANLNADNAKIYGNTTLSISSTTNSVPKFNSSTYGGSVINNATASYSDDSVQTLNISGGTFGSAVYGCSQLVVANAHHDGKTVINLMGKLDDTLYSGSYFMNANNKHNGSIVVNAGSMEITGTFYGGSRMSYNASSTPNVQNGEHVGDIKVYLDGTTTVDCFGGSLLESPRALHSGNIDVKIYANTNIKGHFSAGAKLWYNGNGYRSANDTNTGVEASGDVKLNVYNTKKNGEAGNPVKFLSAKRLYVAAYGSTSQAYRVMSGNVNYYINGSTLPTEAYGGIRACATGDKTTGNIKGVLENVTFSSNYFGGSNLSGASTSDEGKLELTLINTNVTGIVAAGSNMTVATAKKTGKSTLNYESGTVSGKLVAGCYFTKSGIAAVGESELVFGSATTNPIASSTSTVVAGSLCSTTYSVSGGNVNFKLYGGTLEGTNHSLLGSTVLADGGEARLKIVGDIQMPDFVEAGATNVTANAKATTVLDLTMYTGDNASVPAEDETNFDRVLYPIFEQVISKYEVLGSGIRTGDLAFRCRARIDMDYFNDYKSDYSNGYKITRVGIIASTKSELLELGDENVTDAWSYANGQLNPQIGGNNFATDVKYPNSYLFQAAVTGYGDIDNINALRAGTKLSFRGYLEVEYEDGIKAVIYLDNPADNNQTNYQKSLYDTASQIKAAAESQDESDLKAWYNASALNAETIEKIISAVK